MAGRPRVFGSGFLLAGLGFFHLLRVRARTRAPRSGAQFGHNGHNGRIRTNTDMSGAQICARAVHTSSLRARTYAPTTSRIEFQLPMVKVLVKAMIDLLRGQKNPYEKTSSCFALKWFPRCRVRFLHLTRVRKVRRDENIHME